jgi:hypothetical protein
VSSPHNSQYKAHNVVSKSHGAASRPLSRPEAPTLVVAQRPRHSACHWCASSDRVVRSCPTAACSNTACTSRRGRPTVPDHWEEFAIFASASCGLPALTERTEVPGPWEMGPGVTSSVRSGAVPSVCVNAPVKARSGGFSCISSPLWRNAPALAKAESERISMLPVPCFVEKVVMLQITLVTISTEEVRLRTSTPPPHTSCGSHHQRFGLSGPNRITSTRLPVVQDSSLWN